MYDDRSAAALREQILSMCDTRAVLVELMGRLDQLQNCQTMSIARQQVLALQVCPLKPPQLLARCTHACMPHLQLAWECQP